MNRYLVVSCETGDFGYDATFYHDFVLAEDEQSAKEKVLGVRDYCDGADAIDITTLRTHLECLSTWSDEKIQESWTDIVIDHDVIADEQD